MLPPSQAGFGGIIIRSGQGGRHEFPLVAGLPARLDPSGKIVALGQTSELSRDLPPGKYRIRIEALGQQLEEPLTIAPDKTTEISLGVEGDRFVLRR